MRSLSVEGLYSVVWVLLFFSTARALQRAEASAGLHRLYARDEWDSYEQVLSDFLHNGTCSAAESGGDLMIAVASYITPSNDSDAWTRLIGYPNDKMPILVANVLNGPDYIVNDGWQNVISRASAAGKTVLGYVRTGYLGQNQDGYQTRLGSRNAEDWAAQIEQDVDAWYRLYPNDIHGIFFDEGWPECGNGVQPNRFHDLYKYINDYTKRKYKGAYTVLNPGSPIASCFEDTMDTLLTFELNYTMYVNSYTPNNWTPKDPRKLWHIVYDVPAESIGEVASLARQRGAGFLQLTNDVMPNPYDTLPDESYMQSQLAQAAGGSLLNTPASDWPSGEAVGGVGGQRVTEVDYTSALVSWEEVAGAFGYNVYVNDKLNVSVPERMTFVTVGGLEPATSNSFAVTAIGNGGNEGPRTSVFLVRTLPLPDSGAISNASSSGGATYSVFQADVLVPYAFVRLFIWDQVNCDLVNYPGWPIEWKPGYDICALWMVEGTKLFRYTGTIDPPHDAPWAWTEILDEVPIDHPTKYTYRWTLPYGSDTPHWDATRFVVQGQGYNPIINIFQPGNDSYSCGGSTLCETTVMPPVCDHARDLITRSDTYFYNNTGNAGQTGVCKSENGYGCGIFVQGGGICSVSGNQLYTAYQLIHGFRGCEACGSYRLQTGVFCSVKIDFVTGC